MHIKIRHTISVIICFFAAVTLVCFMSYRPLMHHLKEASLRWRFETKISAINEVDAATRNLFVIAHLFEPVLHDIEIEDLPYDDYESVKEEYINCVDEAKANLELHEKNFDDKASFAVAVGCLHQINQQALDAGIPKTGISDLLNYVGRGKAAFTAEAKSAALYERARTAKTVAEKAYFESVANYMSQKFATDELTAELDARMQKHLEELEAIRIAQEKAAEEARQREEAKQWQGVPTGAAGRLRIPAYGISIPLYSSMSQGVVDTPNSAAIFGLNGVTVIGDHWNQDGFGAVRSMAIGTEVYIDYPGGSVGQYHVTYRGTGTNASTNLLFSDGSPVDARYGGLVLYTCLSNWQNVSIVCCG